MLDKNFQTLSGVSFKQLDGIEAIEIENEYAKASITTYGACVLSYVPQQQQDLLWVSNKSVYDGSKPVRGGVPICWPWFGKALSSDLPAHGFVRNKEWQLAKLEQLDSSVTRLQLTTQSDEQTKAMWPYEFELSLAIEIGRKLIMSLTTVNCDSDAFTVTEALHTYFNIGLPQGLRIEGLADSIHSDKLVNNALPQTQAGDVVLNPPMDSVFQNANKELQIHDEVNGRVIRIRSRNANSAVVWNPGAEIVKGFSDIAAQGWKEFACVESGNVLDDFVTIAPGSKHTLSVEYSII